MIHAARAGGADIRIIDRVVYYVGHSPLASAVDGQDVLCGTVRLLTDGGRAVIDVQRVRDVDRPRVRGEVMEHLMSEPDETYRFTMAPPLDDGPDAWRRLTERNAELAQALTDAGTEIERTRIQLSRTHEELMYTQRQFQRVDAELGAAMAQLGEAQSALAVERAAVLRFEASVTWQALQRLRGAIFALAGGEGSRAVRALQWSLRRVGRRFELGEGDRRGDARHEGRRQPS
jgi:hypothetical protein